MEAIRISCAGYPTRRTFDEFIDRFSILLPKAAKERYFILEREIVILTFVYAKYICL